MTHLPHPTGHDESSHSGLHPGPVVFAVATASERRGIEKALRSSTAAPAFVQTGIGPLDIDALVLRLARDKFRGLISIGTCGGLAPRAAAGTLLLPITILEKDENDMKVDPGWHRRVHDALQLQTSVLTDALITVDRVVRTPVEKRGLHQDTGAIAADMESAALLRMAGELGIPFIALRVVLDACDETLPASIAAGVDAAGNATPLKLLRATAAQPGDIPKLIHLVTRLRSVNTVLGRALGLIEEILLTP